MSLNSEQMLPARVRKMRQMEDLLNVEDIILIEIERIIDEMYGAAALLHEELVNEAWLKEKLDARTGADTTVEADADKLLATITLDVSKIVGVDMKDIRAFLNKWLPAHLRYRVILLIESGYISPEKYTVTGMALGYEAQFWPVRTLNGAWLLDGTYNLDAVRKLKIAHHVRYMDNYTLADDNKKKLHQALLYIRQALGKMRLRMKNDWQVFRFEYTKKNGKKTGRCVSAMGWLFYRSKVLIRKHILLHVERIARKLHKKEENGQRFPLGLCRGFVSLLGWITHSETYDWYLIHIKELVNVRKIKRIISKMTREVNRHAGMEKGTLQRAA